MDPLVIAYSLVINNALRPYAGSPELTLPAAYMYTEFDEEHNLIGVAPMIASPAYMDSGEELLAELRNILLGKAATDIPVVIRRKFDDGHSNWAAVAFPTPLRGISAVQGLDGLA